LDIGASSIAVHFPILIEVQPYLPEHLANPQAPAKNQLKKCAEKI
jgi:hypothetical protein